MWTSRKNNCKDSLYQRQQKCKGKNTEIQEIGSIRCTRSNKIAHRKCQCLTESLRPLLPFPLLLCSGGVRYTSHLVFPLWLEKHTLPLCFAVVSKEALLISSSGRSGINFQPFFSDFIWLGWRANSDLSFSSCSGCDLESSAITSTAANCLYDLWTKPDKDSMTVSWRPPIVCEPSRQIFEWLLLLHALKWVRSVSMCGGGTWDLWLWCNEGSAAFSGPSNRPKQLDWVFRLQPLPLLQEQFPTPVPPLISHSSQ